MNKGHDYALGDRVYYLYTDAAGNSIKFAAVVIGLEPEGVAIRVGRYDPHRMAVTTFESVVCASSLQARSLRCSYEDELRKA